MYYFWFCLSRDRVKESKSSETRTYWKTILNTTIMILQCYGYLFGKIRLIKDITHDEVYIEQTNHVIMRNNCWLYTYHELVAIANEIEEM